jgi:hypothetical protein
MLWFLKNFRRIFRRKKWSFWLETKLINAKCWIITLVFEKNANFFNENCQKSQKIVIIDPRTKWLLFWVCSLAFSGFVFYWHYSELAIVSGRNILSLTLTSEPTSGHLKRLFGCQCFSSSRHSVCSMYVRQLNYRWMPRDGERSYVLTFKFLSWDQCYVLGNILPKKLATVTQFKLLWAPRK